MGKTLITCEKLDIAENIAEILGMPTKKINGSYFENEDYIITWSFGHLINWKDPHEIKEEYKTWSLDPLPFRFDITKDQKVISGKNKLLGTYKTLLNRADVDLVVNAGDSDREGLLIQEEIYAWSKCTKPIKVLWAQSKAQKEVVKCLNNLKDRNDFIPLLDAAKARTTIDYMLGITETRGLNLTCFKGQRISYGRCQTPLLKLLSDREIEIKNFKVSDYFEIECNFDNKYKGILYDVDKKESIKFTSKEEANNIINQLSDTGKIIEYKKELKKEDVQSLYSLSSLQKEMGNKYHFTADKTLNIAQSLYEKKLTSYPRTDSEFINDEVFEGIADNIKSAKNIICVTEELDINKLKVVCKPNKVTGHHGLIPTEEICSKEKYNKLSEDEKLVYNAICKRLLAIIMPEYKYYSISVLTDVNGKIFKTTATEIIDLGWKKLYKDEKSDKEDKSDDKNVIIPELEENGTYNVSNKEILSKKTKAPARYTSATIISLMEKYKIGRPATQAEIINRLIEMDFIKFEKNKYEVLPKGLAFIELVLDELKSPELTKNIEEKLSEIADGNLNWKTLIDEVYENQKKRIEVYKNMAGETNEGFLNAVKETDYICPICGSKIINNTYSYNCKNENCGLKINKEISGKKIPERAIADLFAKGKCGLIKGFKSQKTGNEYNAKLKINPETKKLDFIFEVNK